jgi:hypothetical protein
MPEPTNHAENHRAAAVQTSSRAFLKREPGLAILLLGLAAMILALILPQEHRTFAFYPALACVGIGVILTLRHGPDRPKNG